MDGTYSPVYQSTSGNGTLRMREAAGIIENLNTATLGTTLASRVQGTVEWAGAVAQQVQANLYFTNLATSGAGVKTYQGNAWVYGSYLPAGGDRNYQTFTFYYNGQDQDVFPENGSAGTINRYNNLEFVTNDAAASIKTVAQVAGVGGEVHVAADFTSDAASTLQLNDDMRVGQTGGAGSTVAGPVIIGTGALGEDANFYMNLADINYTGTLDATQGSFNINSGGNGTFDGIVTVDDGSFNILSTGNATLNAAVNINNGGTFSMQDQGNADVAATLTVADGGSVTMADNITGILDINGTLALGGPVVNGGALLSVGLADNMIVSGAFTNDNDARTNMTFADGSTVTFDGAGAQSVMSTAQGGGNDYDNLIVEGGGIKVPYSNPTFSDINIRGDFTLGALSDTYLAMAPDATNSTGILVMTDGAANYNGASEVRGKMRRRAISTGVDYNFHNTNTLINFATVPDSYYELDIRPGTYSPTLNVAAPPVGIIDINRKFTVTSATATTQGEIASIQLAYLPVEYGAGTREDLIRMIEGDGGDRLEKIITGIPQDNTDRDIVGATWHHLRLRGGNVGDQNYLTMVNAANGRDEFWQVGQGHDIVLTDQQNYLISIRSGRWSADNTWDEGRPPRSDENCIIRDIVWVGMEQALFGGSATALNEHAIPGVVAGGDPNTYILANQVTIDPVSAPTTRPNCALLIGDNDADMNDGLTWIFGVSTGDMDGIWQYNNAAFTWDESATGTNNVGLHGLYVLDPSHPLTSASGVPAMRASQISNRGSVVNNSIIEIGD